jgi:arabinose-5-phosphate isomerase
MTAAALDVARRTLAIEAEGLARLSEALDDAFVRAVEVLGGLKGRIILTGVGKSGHVARKIAATLASTGAPSHFVHAGEASHGDLGMIAPGDAVIALSKSGEARELADIVAHAKRFAIPLIGMTCAGDSALGRAADILLLIPDAPEAAPALNAPTTSTTLQMALGDALAVALLSARGFTAHDFGVLHPGGKLGAALKTAAELMHRGEELPLVTPDTPMQETLLVMTARRFGVAGVVDGEGRLAGVVSDGDLRRHMDGLLGHTAGEVMTHGPITVSPRTLAAEALRIMNERRVTVLFVVDEGGAPAGLLHVHDLLRAGAA